MLERKKKTKPIQIRITLYDVFMGLPKWTFHQEVPEDTSACQPATVKTNTNTKNETEQAISEQKQHNKKAHANSFNNCFHDWKLGSINIRSGKEKSKDVFNSIRS